MSNKPSTRDWQNTYLPREDLDVEVILRDNTIHSMCVEFVYDPDIDNNDNTPKWWCEKLKTNFELRNIIGWRYT